MGFNVNPFSWKAFNLSIRNKAFDDAMREWQKQVADFCIQVQSLFTAKSVASFLNAQNLLLATALSNSLTDLGNPAGNSTIDTKQAAVIAVRVSWLTAANWTLTLNNVAQGALIFMRLVNSSGAARTFTVAANNPASAAYTVVQYAAAVNTLSSGISVNNNIGINAFGVAYTVTSTPTIHLVGSLV